MVPCHHLSISKTEEALASAVWGFFYKRAKAPMLRVTTRLRFIEPQLASPLNSRQRGSTEVMKSNTMAPPNPLFLPSLPIALR